MSIRTMNTNNKVSGTLRGPKAARRTYLQRSTRAALLVAMSFTALAALPRGAFAGPEIPGEEQKQPIALVGGTIHTVSGPTIEDGVLLFERGRITKIGKDIELPANTKQISVVGKHVYPSLFDAHTNLGLVEVNSVKATVDDHETGHINPNVKAQVAYNPDSEIIPVTRSSGVLLSLVAPTGELVSGRSAVMQMDGWTWEDATLRDDIALHMTWPDMMPVYAWLAEKSPKEQMEARDKQLDELRQTFANAEAYRKARQAAGSRQPVDARWESLLPVLAGKLPVIIHADEAQGIQAAVAFCERHKLKMILYGGYDAEHCAALLKKHNIPVIVAGVQRLPMRRAEEYDAPYTLPERLRKAGLKFCISVSGRFGASNVRNLPYNAGMAVAFGLPHDEALKSITLYPAEILGVADRVGSLDAGKDATLIVTDGDPLETATQVEAAFIQGRAVDLNDRHKRLWKKYEEKYRRQAK